MVCSRWPNIIWLVHGCLNLLVGKTGGERQPGQRTCGACRIERTGNPVDCRYHGFFPRCKFRHCGDHDRDLVAQFFLRLRTRSTEREQKPAPRGVLRVYWSFSSGERPNWCRPSLRSCVYLLPFTSRVGKQVLQNVGMGPAAGGRSFCDLVWPSHRPKRLCLPKCVFHSAPFCSLSFGQISPRPAGLLLCTRPCNSDAAMVRHFFRSTSAG